MGADERTTVVPDGAPADDPEDTVGLAMVGPAGVVPELGQHIGRYQLIEVLGGGGMGTVFAALDPQLGRRIALKVLRTPGSAPGARAELLREAQALAQLSHPNVVPIYDVGIEGELVWLAMPELRGASLQQWLASAPRSWQQVAEVFVGAAAGLAAAHREDLVHGDFKPSNVIITAQQGVLVIDFGLARRIGRTPSIELARADALPRHDEATSDGVVRGTPGYMAPELLGGRPVDARTDQFAFCVALFHALHHHHPFLDDGDTVDRAAVTRMLERIGLGRTRGPRQPGVPRAIDRLILRGLSAAPGRRWPSMEVLARRLERSCQTRPRWVAPLALGGALGVLGLAWLAPSQRSRCDEDPLAELWDDRRAAGITSAIERVDTAWAADTAARVDAGLRVYVARWHGAFAQVCVADDGDAGFDRSLRCLADRRVALATTLDVLERADAGTSLRAVAAVQSLDDPLDCLTRGSTQEHAVRGPELAALLDRFAEIDALDAAGRYEAARDAALAASVAAEALADERLQAQAEQRLGSAHDRLGELTLAEPALDRAVWLALAAGDEDVAVAAMADLVKVVGHDLLRLEDGRAWERHAEATLARIDARPRLVSALRNSQGLLRLAAGEPDAAIERFADAVAITEADGAEPLRLAAALNNYANALAAAGRYDEARGALAHAIDLLERVLGPDHPMLAGNLSNIGFIAERQGRLDDARGFLERAVAISEAGLGEGHPGLYEALNNLAVFHYSAGELERAEQLFTRALTLAERHLGADHPALGRVVGNLALCASERGDPQGALVLYDRALALQQRALGEEHVDVALTLNNRASALRRLGRFDEARAGYQRALAIREIKLGREHPDLATTVDNLGLLAVAQGDPRAAIALHERALAIWTKVHGERHEKIGRVLTELGSAYGQLGEHEPARRLLERALAIYGSLQATDPTALAENQLALAAELTDDRERARALARAALDAYEKAGAGYTGDRDEARALLGRIGG